MWVLTFIAIVGLGDSTREIEYNSSTYKSNEKCLEAKHKWQYEKAPDSEIWNSIIKISKLKSDSEKVQDLYVKCSRVIR